ncbi:MAG: YraN family protein [Actinobacteria bacterium]|nr:YraN family protein [Actinomycetota bacterium]
MARARWAENLVANLYAREGHEIVARNWHCRDGELDIVAVMRRPQPIIVVVEVRARASSNFGAPFESVTRSKQTKLRLAIRKFLQTHPEIQGVVRFDVASVLGVKIEVLHGAF